ncbi:MFS transporter [Ectothiorhodospiraceae bacterium 2226]|nr:MFS transporter [Ectothiorhodospiraceae bacterium 2226]
MSPYERRAALGLGGIYALRMLGLFLILPVFALYAEDLHGVTPFLVGMAIGVYGLTQAVFQIPFGLLSDRVGRKRVIVLGLLIFALGSVVAALADTIWLVIFGRALQGAGAVAAALMALAADLTREEQRVKAMAIIGASIGTSFAAAMVLGPVLGAWIGVQGIFWTTAALALLGIGVLYVVVPAPPVSRVHADAQTVPAQLGQVLRAPELLRLDAGILLLHLILTASFVVIPLVLRDTVGLPAAQHWQVYLGVMVLSLVAMVPFVIVAERKRRLKQFFLGAIVLLGVAQLGLAVMPSTLLTMFVLLWLFFAAFNLLEASLPSLIAKIAPAQHKGSAMGVYTSSQFLGAFLGGALGGSLYGAVGAQGVFLACAGLALLWLALAAGMADPRYLSSQLLRVGALSDAEAAALVRRLRAVAGVAEAVIPPGDEVAYLKVDRHRLDQQALQRIASERG